MGAPIMGAPVVMMDVLPNPPIGPPNPPIGAMGGPTFKVCGVGIEIGGPAMTGPDTTVPGPSIGCGWEMMVGAGAEMYWVGGMNIGAGVWTVSITSVTTGAGTT